MDGYRVLGFRARFKSLLRRFPEACFVLNAFRDVSRECFLKMFFKSSLGSIAVVFEN